MTWPPLLNRSYLTIEGPDVIDFSKIRLFHTGGGRTGQKTENPCMQFRGQRWEKRPSGCNDSGFTPARDDLLPDMRKAVSVFARIRRLTLDRS